MNPVMLIAVPLIAAFISSLFAKRSSLLLLFAAFVNSVIAIAVSLSAINGSYSMGGWSPPYGIELVVTDMTRVLVPAVNILAFFAIVVYWRRQDSPGKYSIVYTISLAALNGILLTNDLFNLFVFLEIAGVSAYLLASTGKTGSSKVAAFKYLMIGSVGSILYLLGVVLVYATTGTLNISEIAARISLGQINGDVLLLSSLLFMIGLGVEAKLLPLNGWVPDVFTKSSGPATLVLASIYPLAMISAFIRVLLAVRDERTMGAALVLGVATVIGGEVVAFGQKRLRRTLAYSSIAQSGLAILLVGVGTAGAIAASVMIIVNNALAKFVLFSVDGLAIEKIGSDDIEKITGFGRTSQVTGLVFTVSALSIAGMPLFMGFRAKLLVISSSFDTGLLIPVIILLAAAIEATYYFRWIFSLYKPSFSRVEPLKERLPLELLTIGIILAAVLVFLGTSSGETLAIFDSAGNFMEEIIFMGKTLIGGM